MKYSNEKICRLNTDLYFSRSYSTASPLEVPNPNISPKNNYENPYKKRLKYRLQALRFKTIGWNIHRLVYDQIRISSLIFHMI